MFFIWVGVGPKDHSGTFGGQSAPLMDQRIIVEAGSETHSAVSLRDARNVSKQTVRVAHVTHS